MKRYRWNREKNETLAKERNISFEAIVYAINKGDLIDIFDHPNSEKYPHQKIYAVNINNYIFLVPFVKEEKDILFLKTIIPSRKATKQYLRSKEDEK